MSIDHQIEAVRSLLNAEIIKNNYALSAGSVLRISRQLDELLIIRHKQRSLSVHPPRAAAHSLRARAAQAGDYDN